jgi:ABC-2 type transport system ATP-binding protein
VSLALDVKDLYKSFYGSAGKDTRKGLAKFFLRKKRKKIAAVDRISFAVPKGEIFGIIGPNGSGKSTLIRCISTLLLPDSGTMHVFDHDVLKEVMEVRRLINRVSVDAAFFKKLSAYENLRYAARLYGVPLSTARKSIEEIFKRLGFPASKINSSMEELSRGMQQKVAVARAFFTSPVLLLLDEPTTGLDPKSKREVQSFIADVRHLHDATVLITTHDMAEAETMCDRIAIIDQGHFVAVGTPGELKEKAGGRNLDDVFIELTGKEWVEHVEMDKKEDDDDATG